jgi:hypothetical protein
MRNSPPEVVSHLLAVFFYPSRQTPQTPHTIGLRFRGHLVFLTKWVGPIFPVPGPGLRNGTARNRCLPSASLSFQEQTPSPAPALFASLQNLCTQFLRLTPQIAIIFDFLHSTFFSIH